MAGIRSRPPPGTVLGKDAVNHQETKTSGSALIPSVPSGVPFRSAINSNSSPRFDRVQVPAHLSPSVGHSAASVVPAATPNLQVQLRGGGPVSVPGPLPFPERSSDATAGRVHRIGSGASGSGSEMSPPRQSSFEQQSEYDETDVEGERVEQHLGLSSVEGVDAENGSILVQNGVSEGQELHTHYPPLDVDFSRKVQRHSIGICSVFCL